MGLDSATGAGKVRVAGPCPSMRVGAQERGSRGPEKEEPMVLDVRGSELGPGLMVQFWCSALDRHAKGYVEALEAPLSDPNRVLLRATEPKDVRGMCFEVWAADCEVLKGPHGRPLAFAGTPADAVTGRFNVREVEDGAERGSDHGAGGASLDDPAAGAAG